MKNVVSVMFKGIFSRQTPSLEDGLSEVFLDLDEKVKTDLRPYFFSELENKFRKNVRSTFFDINYVTEDSKDGSEEAKDGIRELSIHQYITEKNTPGSVAIFREGIVIGSYKETKKLLAGN
jgi:hypothetical protein